MPEFGELKSVPVRTVWPSEARDFTPWLAENIDRLNEALGMDLEIVAQEMSVGSFAVDIVARDVGTGGKVVIENQFGGTDHDHLGKIITYAAGVDALSVIWVTETIRDEHRQALEWLNRRTDDAIHFFAVVVEVLQVDASRPAVVFKPVVYPNEWQRATREATESKPTPREEAYRRYFQVLIDELREQHHFTRARAAQLQSWYSFASGVSGIAYGTSFAQGGRARCDVYIDYGDAETTKALFDDLFAQKATIESEFGEPLEWERLDDRRASKIAVYRAGTIDRPESELVEIRAWAIDRLLRLKRVFAPRIPEVLETVLSRRTETTATA